MINNKTKEVSVSKTLLEKLDAIPNSRSKNSIYVTDEMKAAIIKYWPFKPAVSLAKILNIPRAKLDKIYFDYLDKNNLTKEEHRKILVDEQDT